MNRPWIKPEVKSLRTLYPHIRTADIAEILGRDQKSVQNKAHHLGLRKSNVFQRSDLSGHLHKGSTVGSAYRFPKGHLPWNAGMKGLDIGGEKTRFKKGNVPPQTRPVGSKRINKEGHIEVKVAEPNVWQTKQQVLWERHRGPVPRGSVLRFKRLSDGVKLSNLELITRAENMRRNSYQRYPKELAKLIQLRGALNRQINKRIGREK